MVTQNELRFAANVPDAYVLALVEVSADGAEHDRVRYLDRPYGADVRLPFDTTSTTLSWHALLAASHPTTGRVMPTKLIEVALPLDVINKEAAREKSIRHGHPSTLHLWWARRPLAACRAVLFAQLVDDPSAHPELFPTEADQERERKRLFDIIERLVPWEASTDEKILEEARAEIRRCYPDGPPPIIDPFCGGGSIPLEAQRLGLEAHASDLNPVAVLITKALIELPPKFADRPPVHPDSGSDPARDAGLGEVRRASPRTFATTVSGCAMRRSAGSGISTQRSRFPMGNKPPSSHGSGPEL